MAAVTVDDKLVLEEFVNATIAQLQQTPVDDKKPEPRRIRRNDAVPTVVSLGGGPHSIVVDPPAQLKLNVPAALVDRDVLIKVEKAKVPEDRTVKFRSFKLPIESGSGVIVLGDNKRLAPITLLKVLREHGLPETIPCEVSLAPLITGRLDWHPLGYAGPTVWHFKWRGQVPCSITGRRDEMWFRVHDTDFETCKRVLRELGEELLLHWVPPKPQPYTITIYVTVQLPDGAGYAWSEHSTRKCRDLATVYLPPEHKERLRTGLDKFLGASELYDRFGITWKRVHLFHGPPGSGKTSTIVALASMYHRNLAKLTLTPGVNSQHLESLFGRVPANTWLVLEDVDALFTERKAESGVDFSTLLNALDGITTKRGLIVFATTNHRDKLDAAFLRPGRIDMELEFKPPGKDELRMALQTLGPQYAAEHEEFLEKHGAGITIADIQRILFERIMEEKTTLLG